MEDWEIIVNSTVELVAKMVENFCRELHDDWEVVRQGKGLETVFHFKAPGHEVHFRITNTVLDILLVDRDTMPVPDPRCVLKEVFEEKFVNVVTERLSSLEMLMTTGDEEATLEQLAAAALRTGSTFRCVRVECGGDKCEG